MMKLYLLSKKVFILVFLFSGYMAMAQSNKVTGRVTSGDDGTALPGVSILEKGTTNGTVTDADGNYSVTVRSDATLIFSFVGYASQEVAIAGRTTVDITLLNDVTSLNEVLVVGYGEVQKKDATGAVVNISSKDFNKGVLTSPQDLMLGKIAGVAITSNSGAPGASSTIRIRGGSSLSASNDPLIVIDGFPVDNVPASGDGSIAGVPNVLASLNPNDIETFTVLKDASASVWQTHDEGEHEVLHDEMDSSLVTSKLVPSVSANDSTKEITSMLIQYRSPMGAVQLPRIVNSQSSLQAASPAFETARLFSILGIGVDILMAFAYVLIVISGLSIFIALYNSLKERRYDMAIMRSMGATRSKLFVSILMEGGALTLFGSLIGLLMGHGVLILLSMMVEETQKAGISGFVFYPQEWVILGGSLVLGLACAILPAIQAYRVDISKILGGN